MNEGNELINNGIPSDAEPIGLNTRDEVFSLLASKTDGKGNARPLQTVRNFEIVLENDIRFVGRIRFNEFSQQTYLIGSTVWENRNNYRPWSSFDDSAAFAILQSDYGLNSRNDYFDAINNVARRNRFHPVRELLLSLEWDGKEHIRHLLPDFLGAMDSEYTFQVMRLWMLGAVARVLNPGCKFDYVIILVGRQGVGKSTFLNKLTINGDWFNDSLDSLDGSEAAQLLTGSWIIELAELKSLARTAGGVDSVKRFLSARQDKLRLPYARRADIFQRQCVFAGSTNKTDFLADETGNRRFLIIETGVNEPRKNIFSDDEAVMDEIKQAWGEAAHIYTTEHPKLVLPDSVRHEAEQRQEASMSDDGKIGIITEFLSDKSRVCALEVWREALGETGRPQKWQASEINTIIARLPGWKKMSSPARFGEYGSQRGFQKNCSQDFMTVVDDEVADLPFG